MKNFRSTKYHNRKTVVDGITFDSQKEAERYQELMLLMRAGEITALERQKKYTLIPKQKSKSGKVLERECTYTADFVYKTKEGAIVVEDVKGFRGGGAYEIFKIKRKLMLWRYGIRVMEV